MTDALTVPKGLARSAATVGAVALVACIAGAIAARTVFLQAWLASWLFLLGIALAALINVMIHELTGGHWGVVLRRPLEAAALSLPLLALFALPLLLGIHDLLPWATLDQAQSDVVRAKGWYLNVPAFVLRNIAWLVLWSAFAFALRRHLDQAPLARTGATGRRIAVAGLLVYLLTVTFFAVDWIASLTPEWFSTAVGIRLGASQFLAAFGFAVPFAVLHARSRPNWAQATPRDLQDIGTLLLTFAMTWAYFAFAQYLIVWGEDLPSETSWYWPRTQTSWRYLAPVIGALCFGLPVAAMLFREVKRSAPWLAAVCALVLVGQWLDTVWLVLPSLRLDGFALHWLDFAALVAEGGLWLAVVATIVERLPLPAAAPKQEVVRG
jgi:hypothetical protein